MVGNPFIPQSLIGRQFELEQLSQILARDGDLLITGVPGSGRRTLIRRAAQRVGARVLEIDCLRAIDNKRFLQLLAESVISVFSTDAELSWIERWSENSPLIVQRNSQGRAQLIWQPSSGQEWLLFQILLALPQQLADWLDCRVVLVLQNFPHIRSWDKGGKWEDYLRQEIQRQSRVSYALIATIAEAWVQDSNLQVISLPPLNEEELRPWLVSALAAEGLKFVDETALQLFFDYVQGNFGDAIALARRIWLDYRALLHSQTDSQVIVQAHHVHRSALSLVEDLSLTFESLILLLPPSQVRVLESLALDPTDSPHSRHYIRKHQLSRGGSLQGALASLEQKGLVYGPKYGYRLALPLLAFWLKQRLA